MENQKSSTIFINPKFKNAYINPNFLKNSSATQIHLNPRFIQNQQIPNAQVINQPSIVKSEISTVKNNAIIKNTKRSLIRAPVKVESDENSQILKVKPTKDIPTKLNLIKISNTKLVNASHLMKYQQKENEVIKNITESLIKSKKKLKAESVYKIDRRKAGAGSIQKKKSNTKNGLSPKKFSKQASIRTKSYSNPQNTKLLSIRGQKFILDRSGKTLFRKRDSNSSITLPSSANKGKSLMRTLSNEQDKSQRVRNHLTLAKTKSISVLQRTTSSLKTTNVICPIYRRIGKCLAYAKGKCSKIHDPRYVIVCPRFIKGLCNNEKCLLSHNANLHKMPVCKYYLQGTCLKNNDECLYLHKKVSDGTKLCSEFLKGYCPLADKCTLLHDHIESDRRKYSVIMKKKNEVKEKVEIQPISDSQKAADSRYFVDATPSPTVQQNIPKFTKTAPILPHFIKL
ncbi:hypothetical protein PVAND_006210 [Polypedilum vanderplanki]|uniref:C3H1-type domain-containing protein n=1 Tax=Polypedilum vanderplanki TaxID=319348 RepID=A0A9J6C2G5_POLVA|nr:hypothetical protein PVAND_006210 [Polypedilum vanderplanki]